MRGHVGRGRAPPGSPRRSREQGDAVLAAVGALPLSAAAPTQSRRKCRDNRRLRSGATPRTTSRPPAAVGASPRGISFPAIPTETHPRTDGPRSPPPRRRRLFPGSAGRASRASCALKAINTIWGIFNCSIKHAVNNYSQLC